MIKGYSQETDYSRQAARPSDYAMLGESTSEQESPQPYLEYLCHKIEQAADRINQLGYEMSEHADRLHGIVPSEIAKGMDAPDKGAGICAQLDWRIQILHEMIGKLEVSAKRNIGLA